MNSIPVVDERMTQKNACDAIFGAPAVHRYFTRVSRSVEYGILIFVILTTLLGNYVNHNYLMRDLLLS